jgi:hypothetical protein
MTDKTLNKQAVAMMRKLFWEFLGDKISHNDLMAELDRINNKQMTLEMSEKEVKDG